MGSHRRKDPHCSGLDRGQLVHIPRCVLVPHDGHQCCTCRRRNSGWLLLLRHHLQVRCRNRDLPDLLREDPEGCSLAMKSNGCIPRDATFPWTLIFFLLGPMAGRLGTYISFPEVAFICTNVASLACK